MFYRFEEKLLDQLFVQFGGMLIDGDAFAFSTVISWLLAIYRSCTYIKRQSAVYIIKLFLEAIHPSQEYFGVKDILPNVSDETCCHLDYIHDKNGNVFIAITINVVLQKENVSQFLQNFVKEMFL